MSNIDLIDKEEFEEAETIDDSIVDIDEKTGKRRTTKHQLKVRRAIEEHLEKQRFRKEVDYLDDTD